jgi:hypothetical protein
MQIRTLSFLAGTLALGLILAADITPWSAKAQSQEPIYGSQLMTDQERSAYSGRMRSTKTAEEREKIRAEHHKQMTERAKERGVTLPEEPPVRGMGQGMGPGGRMGVPTKNSIRPSALDGVVEHATIRGRWLML